MNINKLKQMKKSTIVIIVAVVILAIIVGSFVVQRLMGNPHPMLFNVGFGYMESSSMGSDLPSRSIIILVKQDRYSVNDIVTYIYDNDGASLSVTNRIIDSIGDVYYLKGDHSQYEDPEVVSDQIVGKVVFHFPSWILIGLVIGLWLSFFATYGKDWFDDVKSKKDNETTETTKPSVTVEEYNHKVNDPDDHVQLEFVFHPEQQKTEVNKIVNGQIVESKIEPLPDARNAKLMETRRMLEELSAKLNANRPNH